MAEYDIVIRNGSILDGTGKPAFKGDVAIKGEWIVAVGNVEGMGAEELDAAGKLVTPGFVDVHTHYDGQSIWSDRLTPSSEHGVTTVVMGNCGIGFAPCRPEDRQGLIELMEGVEDIPGAVSAEGLAWDWESFPEYLDALDRRKRDIDVAALMPHSPVRVYVMGERALNHEAATDEDLEAMRKLFREGLEAGAIGIGTSKLAAHRSSKGELIPSYSADEKELLSLARQLGESGRGVLQMVTDIGYTPATEQLPLVARLAEAAGRTVTYTHPQSADWREALAMLNEVNEKPGVNIKAQLLPRPIGMMLGLTVSFHPFFMTPTYQRIKDLPLAERMAEMRKAEIREAILSETPDEPTNPLAGMTRQWEKMFPTGRTMNYEPPRSESIAGLAEQSNRTAPEVAYDFLLEEGGQSLMLLTLGNYEDGNLDWMEPMLESGNVVLGLGDGGAHYGMITDASFTTFALSHWTRDRSHGRIALEEMIRRLTSEPADLVGLEDRGRIAKGYRASVNVIDYDKLTLYKPHIVSDLPAGGKRLNQSADGYVATIANGKVIVRDSKPTEERPGQLLRGAQSPLRASDLQKEAAPAHAS